MKKNIAESINQSCVCKTLKTDVIEAHLKKEELLDRPNLFSSTMMFISQDDFTEMKTLIESIEKVINESNYQNEILKNSPASAQVNFGTKGVFMGYDFHVTEDGVKLIEINTNAGGALLNAKLARAQHACCVEIAFEDKFEDQYIEMFRNEWSLQRGSHPLKTIAIVDEKPSEQYLYPEFRLFQKLFSDYGYDAVIADPKELTYREGKIFYQEKAIDLIYNRLTDFYLEDENNKSIRDAFLADDVVVTPAPRHHALYANKANLVFIRSFESAVLKKGIPETLRVKEGTSEKFWSERKNYFFKPVSGYGSKASYRGDKLTKRVWEEILTGDYVAQELVPPGKRIVDVDGAGTDLKADVRAYVYEGEIQLLAARLYSGQTTNFRTAGGGFAPVFVTP